MKPNLKLRSLLAAAATLAACSQIAHAASLYWDNNSTDPGFGTAGDTWSSAGSNLWNQDPTGGSGSGGFLSSYATTTSDTVNFGTNTDGLLLGTVTVSGTVEVGNITVGSASGAITLSTGTINIASGGTISNNSASSLSLPALGGSGGFIVNSGGTGSLAFSANITHTGSMRIDNGTVLMGSDRTGSLTKIILNGSGATMRLSGGNLNLGDDFEVTENGGTINRGTGSSTLSGNFTATGNGNRTLNLKVDTAGQNLTLSSAFNLVDPGSGRLSMTKTGPGTLILGVANTFTGSTTITAGTLSLTNVSALQFSHLDTTASIAGDADNGLKTTGAALRLGGLSGNQNLADIYTTTSGGYSSVTGITLNVAADNNLTYSGTIDGSRSLTKSGAGTQILSVANSHANGTTVSDSGGTLKITDAGALGGGSVSILTASTNTGTLELALAGTNVIGNTFNNFASANSLTSPTPGVPQILNTSGDNTISSNLTIGSLGGNTLNIASNGGFLTLAGNITHTLTTGRNLALGGSGNGEVSGAISNNGLHSMAVIKTGAGTWTLSNATNSYTGGTTIGGGTLALGADNVLPDAAVSIGAATLDAATFDDTLGTLNVTGTATINLGTGANLVFTAGGTPTWSGPLNLTGTFVPGDNTDPGTNPGSLRFGTDINGLTGDQLDAISASGWTDFALDDYGFLTATPSGGDDFDSWAGANGITGGENDDDDNDGVSNLVEYALADGQERGSLSGNTLTFTKRGAPYGGDITYIIETSTTLETGSWSPAVTQGPSELGDSLTYTFTPGPGTPKEFARLKVTRP